MREILFRGQTRKRGEKVLMGSGEKLPGQWAYGGIFPGTGDFSIIYGWEDGVEHTGGNLKKFPVYSDTVGEYAGKIDKNALRSSDTSPSGSVPRTAWKSSGISMTPRSC